MSRQKLIAFACHAAACLLFPLATSLGFQAYTFLFGSPLSRGVALGLAVQLIFVAFVLVNGLISLIASVKIKIVLTSALVIANFAYLLPQHPLRALFFAGLSGGLSFAAIYVARRLASTGKNA